MALLSNFSEMPRDGWATAPPGVLTLEAAPEVDMRYPLIFDASM